MAKIDRAARRQWHLVYAVACLYVVLSLAVARLAAWTLIVGAALVWCGMGWLAKRLGRDSKPGFLSVLPVFVLAFSGAFATAALLAATTHGMSEVVVVPLLLEVVVTYAVWALLRYPASRPGRRGPRSLRRDLLWGLALGGAGATVYSAVVFLLYAADGGEAAAVASGAPPLGEVVMGYWGGLLLAGLVAGLLRPLGRYALGAMVLGILGAAFTYGAIGLVLEGPSMGALLMGGALGMLTGPMFGLGFYVEPLWEAFPERAG